MSLATDARGRKRRGSPRREVFVCARPDVSAKVRLGSRGAVRLAVHTQLYLTTAVGGGRGGVDRRR